MTEVAKHKAQRSVSRMIGQYLDAQGKVAGGPTECQTAFPFCPRQAHQVRGRRPDRQAAFRITVKVPKLTNDATTCPNYAGLAAHCMEAATKAWGSWPAGGKWPIQDGDIPYPQKLKPGQTPLTAEQIAERNKWRTGHWVIEATNYLDEGPRVAIVQNGTEQAITSQTLGGQVELYKSGDLRLFPFIGAYTFHNKTFGVNFSLGRRLLHASLPGEKIGGGGRSRFNRCSVVSAPRSVPAWPLHSRPARRQAPRRWLRPELPRCRQAHPRRPLPRLRRLSRRRLRLRWLPRRPWLRPLRLRLPLRRPLRLSAVFRLVHRFCRPSQLRAPDIA
jgi:hypothetical protein